MYSQIQEISLQGFRQAQSPKVSLNDQSITFHGKTGVLSTVEGYLNYGP